VRCIAGMDWELLHTSAVLDVGQPQDSKNMKLPMPIVVPFGDALAGRQRQSQRYVLLRSERKQLSLHGRPFKSEEWVRVAISRETVNGYAVTTASPNFTLGELRYYDSLQGSAGPTSALVLAQVVRPPRPTVVPVFSTTIGAVVSLKLEHYTLRQCTLYQIRVRGVRTGDGSVVLPSRFVWRSSGTETAIALLHSAQDSPHDFCTVVRSGELPPEAAYFSIRFGDRTRMSEWSEETEYIALSRPPAYDLSGRGLLRAGKAIQKDGAPLAVADNLRVELRWQHFKALESTTPLEYCAVVWLLSFNRRDLHSSFYLSPGIQQSVEPPCSRTPSPFPEVEMASEEVAEAEAETLWNYKPRAPPRPLLGETVYERDNHEYALSIDGLTSTPTTRLRCTCGTGGSLLGSSVRPSPHRSGRPRRSRMPRSRSG